MSITEGIMAAIGVVANLFVSAIAGTWALARNSVSIKVYVEKRLAHVSIDVDTKIEMATRGFGEAVAAVRQKMTDMELWGRDNYVSQKVFNSFMEEMTMRWNRFEDKLDARLERMEGKIDKMDNGHKG